MATTKQTTCRKCNRTIFVVKADDGSVVEMDCELITVIPFEGETKKIRARRAHGEMCTTYQTQAEKQKARRKNAT